MIPVTVGDLAGIVGGEVAGAEPGATITDTCVDSRRARAGSVFAAFTGEHVDGHGFAADAVERGAVAVLAERALPDLPCVVVEDSQTALAHLARWTADHLDAPVVAVTGSTGKTSTKDLLGQVLAVAGPTVAPEGSYNNEIGLPLTVLRADAATRFLVLEMSARGIGHIAALCTVAPPTVGIVVNVGLAHVGEFGGRDAIATAKGELVEALPADGLAVLNADDPVVLAMAARSAAPVVRFGRSGAADVRASDEQLTGGRARFRLVTPEGAADVTLCGYGAHQVGNALATAAAARWAGLDVAAVAEALSAARPLARWRMEVTDRADGVTVVNDAYNANPESMAAALRALVGLAGDRRTWAVLGGMAELGDATGSEHERLGELVVTLGINRLVTVGEVAAGTAEAARDAGLGADAVVSVPDVDAAIALLHGAVSQGDVVLVKASRAMALERVAAALLGGREDA